MQVFKAVLVFQLHEKPLMLVCGEIRRMRFVRWSCQDGMELGRGWRGGGCRHGRVGKDNLPKEAAGVSFLASRLQQQNKLVSKSHLFHTGSIPVAVTAATPSLRPAPGHVCCSLVGAVEVIPMGPDDSRVRQIGRMEPFDSVTPEFV